MKNTGKKILFFALGLIAAFFLIILIARLATHEIPKFSCELQGGEWRAQYVSDQTYDVVVDSYYECFKQKAGPTQTIIIRTESDYPIEDVLASIEAAGFKASVRLEYIVLDDLIYIEDMTEIRNKLEQIDGVKSTSFEFGVMQAL